MFIGRFSCMVIGRFRIMEFGGFDRMDIGKLGRIVCYLHLYLSSSYYLIQLLLYCSFSNLVFLCSLL